MSHVIRWNAGKKIKSVFELFFIEKVEFKFVLFLIVQTLPNLCVKRLIVHGVLDIDNFGSSKCNGIYTFM